MTPLLEDVRSEEGIQIAPIGGGRFLAAFVGSDSNAQYSIFSGSRWSEPGSLMAQNDTPDSISAGPFSIYILGNGQLFLSWYERSRSSAENGQAQYLNSQNIVGRPFELTSEQFGGLVKTTITTGRDVVADSNLQLAYDNGTDCMLFYYTKSLYEIDPQSGEPVCTDSQIAYRIYNNMTGKFVGYSAKEEEEIKEQLRAAGVPEADLETSYHQYVTDYYGQRFMDLTPKALVLETVDENGNWSDDPDFAPFPAEGTARIVEYAAESTSSGKALLAYIMDLDGDVSTTGDREVFLSVYDFREGSVLYPPVMVTSGLVEEDAQNLAFTKFELVEGEKTYLTYLSQGELKLVDMACLDSENAVLTGKVEGVTFSYLNKNPEAAAYQEESFFAGTAAQEWKIEDYTTFSTTDGFYVLFTEQGDPANLWAVRYDSGENTVEGPVLLDDAYGAGYDEMAVALDTITGTLAALAVTEASGTARLDALTWSLEKTIANKLVRLENEGIEEPSASGTDAVDAGFEIYNNSFAPIEGITLFITDGNGDSIQAAVELTDGQGNPAPATEPFTLGVGQKATVTFQLPVGSDATKVSFTAQLQASDGTDLGTLQYELPISAEEPDPSPTPPYIPPQPTGPSTAGSDGWEDILDELQGVQSGGSLTIDMNGETEVPAEIFEGIAGKDVEVVFDMGDGVTWTVNGKDVPTDVSFSDIDLGVDMGTSGISVDVINVITGELGSVQVSLSHDGPFGFVLTLTAPLGQENAGYWANLYHYDEGKETLSYETSGEIAEDGTVALRMTHASQYAIVIDEKSHELPFTDLGEGQWYENAVRYAYTHDLMAGTSATTFAPNKSLTRAEAVQILYNLEGQPTVTAATNFADSANHWAATAIAWAEQTGVVDGYEDGTFRPENNVTRQEFAQMMYNYAVYKDYDLSAKGDLSQFSDGDSVQEWAIPAMEWANGNELINGHDDGTLEPGGTTTRAQAASILMRFDQNVVEN